jgi:hypothetical protein
LRALLKTSGYTSLTEAIAFLGANRDKEIRIEVIGSENSLQERHGGDAIDVVVSVNANVFTRINSLKDAIDGQIHIGQKEWIR